MDLETVQAAVMAQIESNMGGAYDGLVVTGSFEDGYQAYCLDIPSITVTVDDSNFVKGGFTEDGWKFLVNMSTGEKAYAQATTTAAPDSERLMSARFRETFNGDASFNALFALGINSECKTWPEDQRTPEMKNPHLILATTYE